MDCVDGMDCVDDLGFGRFGGRRFVLGIVCAVGLLGCADEGRVVYSLEWDTAGVERAGNAWEIVTDLGYRVRLDTGFLVSHTFELIECADPPQRLVSGWLPLLRAFAPAPAYAGHMPALHPFAFRAARVESIVTAAETATRRVVAGGRAYCQLEYLVARADENAEGLPEEVELVGKSLYLEGVFTAADTAAEPFAIASTVASGRRIDLARAGSQQSLRSSAGDAVIAIRRRLGTLFDGVDFARAPEHEWPHRILANVVRDVHVEWHIEARR